MDLEIIDPTEYPGWDDLLLPIPEATIFHTSSWARVLKNSYRYHPVYFTKIADVGLSVLLPIMEINSLITGKRGVALPFTDYCGMIFPGKENLRDLFGSCTAYGKGAKWNFLEIRDGRRVFPQEAVYARYSDHRLDLTHGEERIHSGLRDSTRRNIRKAEKEGVRIRVEESKWALDQFYNLHCRTRKEHGLPPQPKSFFDNIYQYIFSRDLGFVVLGSLEKRTVAAAVFFHFGGNGIYKYGAADKSFQHLRPSNGVMWEGIRWFCQRGYRTLSLGRTEPHHAGLLQYKNGWGAEEREIFYQRYDIPASRFLGEKPGRNGGAQRIFRRLPAPALKLAGRLLYKHFG